jgi:hypothetical protein
MKHLESKKILVGLALYQSCVHLSVAAAQALKKS